MNKWLLPLLLLAVFLTQACGRKRKEIKTPIQTNQSGTSSFSDTSNQDPLAYNPPAPYPEPPVINAEPDVPVEDPKNEKNGSCFYQKKQKDLTYKWVKTSIDLTREQCQNMDSCAEDGGKQSQGGCYKFTENSDDPKLPW